MLLDPANCDANHQRFLERIVASQIVWYLESEDGVANSTSSDDDEEEEESTVFMFWSDRAFATEVQKDGLDGYQETSMDLFDFLYRWLPNMSQDGIIAGTNWTVDLIGVESDPYDLRVEIEALLPEALKQEFDARCLELMKEEDDS